ncbi:hypothetical protein H4582DRAFT_1935656 [Lactarius indigo]|nr:hypothetical protein H4582DRAFT_1935656 [Lactarius indigo]
MFGAPLVYTFVWLYSILVAHTSRLVGIDRDEDPRLCSLTPLTVTWVGATAQIEQASTRGRTICSSIRNSISGAMLARLVAPEFGW